MVGFQICDRVGRRLGVARVALPEQETLQIIQHANFCPGLSFDSLEIDKLLVFLPIIEARLKIASSLP